MALNLKGLPSISQISPEDQILVCTSNGLNTVSVKVLLDMFLSTLETQEDNSDKENT